MLRRKAFDALQDLSEFHFIDLCAGSGAMGIEAWSRGAKSVNLIEAHPKAQIITKKNVAGLKTRFSNELDLRPLTVVSAKAEQWLAKDLAKFEVVGDVVLFFDPPYRDHKLYELFKEMLSTSKVSGEVWVESDRLSGVALKLFESWGEPHKVYEHSDSWLARWKFPIT